MFYNQNFQIQSRNILVHENMINVCALHIIMRSGRDRPLVSLNLEMFNKYKIGSVTCLIRL